MSNPVNIPSPLVQGSTVQGTASGYSPGEQVTLFGFNDPDLEGPIGDPDHEYTTTADENGDISWDIEVPGGDENVDAMGFSLDPDAGWETFITRHVVEA